MITNILATIIVCVVTNVTMTDNARPQQPLWYQYTNNLIYVENLPVINPTTPSSATEKTETTEVVEISTLSFKWGGKPYSVRRERVLSTTSKRFIKQEVWKEIP